MRVLGVALLVAVTAAGQNPIEWSLKRVESKKAVTAQLRAAIENGWHLYGLTQLENGPKATRIWAPEESKYEVLEVKAPKPFTKRDENFDLDVTYYDGQVTFHVPLKPMPGAGRISLKVYYQICSDKLCLPPRTVTVQE